MKQILYLVSICSILVFAGCNGVMYNSAPAFVPMLTKKTEATGNFSLGPEGANANIAVGFLNYLGVYGGGHIIRSIFSFPGGNNYFYGGIMGRHITNLGSKFSFTKELMVDYGSGKGNFLGGEQIYISYFSNSDESNYNPLNAQLNLTLRWKGLACKNVMISFKDYLSKYDDYHHSGKAPDKLSSFTQYVFEPNVFFRIEYNSIVFLLNARWATMPFGGPIFTNSYLPNVSIYKYTQVSLGIQYYIDLGIRRRLN